MLYYRMELLSLIFWLKKLAHSILETLVNPIRMELTFWPLPVSLVWAKSTSAWISLLSCTKKAKWLEIRWICLIWGYRPSTIVFSPSPIRWKMRNRKKCLRHRKLRLPKFWKSWHLECTNSIKLITMRSMNLLVMWFWRCYLQYKFSLTNRRLIKASFTWHEPTWFAMPTYIENPLWRIFIVMSSQKNETSSRLRICIAKTTRL